MLKKYMQSRIVSRFFRVFFSFATSFRNEHEDRWRRAAIRKLHPGTRPHYLCLVALEKEGLRQRGRTGVNINTSSLNNPHNKKDFAQSAKRSEAKHSIYGSKFSCKRGCIHF
jgi:hypothetical protein